MNMHSGEQMKLTFSKNLEPIVEEMTEQERACQAAREYLALSGEAREIKLMKMRKELHLQEPYNRSANAKADAALINEYLGFPMMDWKHSLIPGSKDILITRDVEWIERFIEEMEKAEIMKEAA